MRRLSTRSLALVACVACGDSAADDTAFEGFADPDIVDITVGDFHACVLNHDGESWCWAYQRHLHGQANERLTAFAAGEWHTCGLTPDQRVVCWGRDDEVVRDAPVEGQFVEVCGGDGFACAREASGEVLCWGDGTSVYSHGPVAPEPRPFATPMQGLSCNSHAVCGVDEGGETVCWYSEVGGDPTPPQPMVEFDWFTHACGVTELGELTCWDALEDSKELVTPDGQYHALGVGFRYACALTPEAEIRCWGDISKVPLQMSPPPGRFTRLSVGAYFACAQREDGRVLCWGHDTIDCEWDGPLEGCTNIPESIGEIYRPPE